MFRFTLVAGFSLALLGVVFPCGAAANVIHVSKNATGLGDGSDWENACTSIAAGLALAATGDEVWVRSATYEEAIELKSGVALYGGFPWDGSPTFEDRNWTAYETIVDATQLYEPAIVASDGAVFDGFTITGGEGGVYCHRNSPVISNCRIVDNIDSGLWIEEATPTISACVIARNETNWVGGGCRCFDSSPTIRDCTVSNNGAVQGGGIFLSASPAKIIRCTISGNRAFGAYRTPANGGGIYSEGSSPTFIECVISENVLDEMIDPEKGIGGYFCRSSPTFVDCVVNRNSFPSLVCCNDSIQGGGLCFDDCFAVLENCLIQENVAHSGGGLSCYDSILRLTGCRLSGNRAVGGAGIAGNDSTLSLIGCSITRNSAGWDGGSDSGVGGGVSSASSPVTMINCIVSGNTAAKAGGLYSEGYEYPDEIVPSTVTNCVFTGNEATTGAGTYCGRLSSQQILNSIFWRNPPDEVGFYSAAPEISWSCIHRGWPGDGNIDATPEFVHPWDGTSADVHLLPDSPSIDAGTPDSAYNDACRPPGLGTERNDMGAYGGPFNCDGLPPTPTPTPTPTWTPQPTPTLPSYDLNGDGVSDPNDLFFFSYYWHQQPDQTSAPCDMHDDELIDENDLIELIRRWSAH